MAEIWSSSADSWRKGIHTALSHNNTSGTEFLKLHQHVHGPFLQMYCMAFPSNTHPNSCTLTEVSRGQGAGRHQRPARIHREGKLSLVYSKACSPVQTSYKRKWVEELIYSIPNSSTFCPCVFTCSPHACLWMLWFTDPRANAKQAETSYMKCYCSMKQLFKVFWIRYSNSLLPWGSTAETLNTHDPQFLQTITTPQLLQVFPEWWFFKQNIKPMS